MIRSLRSSSTSRVIAIICLPSGAAFFVLFSEAQANTERRVEGKVSKRRGINGL